MYRRADLWRNVAHVVALLLTAVSTGVFAREFRAVGLQDETSQVDAFHSRQLAAEKVPFENLETNAIELDRTIVALIATMPPVLIARLREVERI